MRRHHPELRAAAVEARAAGVPSIDIARTLNIPPGLVTYWAKQAGLPTLTAGRPCGVCVHPQRAEVDEALIVCTVAAVHGRFPDLSRNQLDRHRRLHLGLRFDPAVRFSCMVCDHPERALIDVLLRRSSARTALAKAFQRSAPGIEVLTPAILRQHQLNHLDNTQRDALRADVATLRSVALSQLEQRSGQ